jgi:hypothetical protein
MASKNSIYVVIVAVLALMSGCAAQTGLLKSGTMEGLDGNFRIYTDRTQDKMGINTVSTFVIKDTDKGSKSDLVYGNTNGQPGIGKAMVEQIIPAISNASIGTFTGVFFPKPGATNINTGTGAVTQSQGQITGQQQGQVGIVGGP